MYVGAILKIVILRLGDSVSRSMQIQWWLFVSCLLFSQGGGDANKEIEGRRLLHIAADYGQLEVIQELVAKGADVNVSSF